MNMQPRNRVTVDLDILLDFFLAFSRFEYALKATGFVRAAGADRRGDPPAVAPDWRSFAQSLGPIFKADATQELREACERLIWNPPSREVLIDEQRIMRDSCLREEPQSEIERLLLFVRTVRNNLFHGGKFALLSLEDVERNTFLLADSLVLLDACLHLSPTVRETFESAAL